MIASRSAGFGDEVKLRILLGTFVLRSGFQDQYYLQALKVRTLIRRDFERCFGGRCDLLLLPAYPVPPFAPGQRGRGSLRAEARRRLHLLGQPRGPARPGVPRRGRARPADRHAARRARPSARTSSSTRPPRWRRSSRRPIRRASPAFGPWTVRWHVRLRGRPRGPRPAPDPHEGLLRVPGRLRRRAEHERLPGLHGTARDAARAERRGDPHGLPGGPGPRLHPRAPQRVRAEELLLPGHAEELPDLAVPLPARHRRPGRRSSCASAAGRCASARCTSRKTRAR